MSSLLLDDVDDFVDDEAHGAAAVGEHQDRLRAVFLELGLVVDAQQRHQLIAVLHEMPAVGAFDLAAIDFLEARDQRQRHRFRLLRAGAEHKERDDILVAVVVAARQLGIRCPRRRGAARPSACATPFGSMIMITEPSPRIVVPEKTGMWRSFDDIGLMTISSVWKTPSTTTPNTWLPTCVTTTKPLVVVAFTEAQHLVEADQRQQLVAQPEHRRVLDPLDAMLAAVAGAHQLEHGKLRDGEALAARLDDQRRDDRQASAES